ncbi:ABC transporter ATP-binding protein [Candidatus Uhrbacteria bacterium]|nr:ABC transporter ATP-binding protein [Candidatus Uhrbacteria bacterium]
METTHNATTRDIVRVYLRHVKPYRGWAGLFFVILLAAEILGILNPWLYKRLFDTMAEAEGPSEAVASVMQGVLLTILCIHAGRWFAYRILARINNYLQPRIMADLEQTAFAYLLGHSYRFFANSFAGSLVRKVRRLSRSFETLADNVEWKFIPLLVTITGTTVALGMRSPLIAGITLGWLFVFAGVNYAVAIWKLKYDQQRAKQDSEVTGILSDAVTNSMNVVVFAGHTHEQSLFKRATEEFRRLQTFTWNLGEINDAIQWAFMVAIEMAILFIAINLWSKGELTIGDFALFQGYLIGLFERMWDFGRIIRNTYEATADAKEMVDILETPHEITDAKVAVPLVVPEGEILFQDVTFSHHKTRTVIDGLNLRIAPREKIALVGPSGAGKSTITKLLLRFYDVDGGHVRVDGQDVNHVTQDSLRRQIAYVPQEPVLFHRSLRENIRYGRQEATDADVEEAARKAHCHEFIAELPEGYETLVGERGIKLSGGERQRVAIARAILKDAPILVLDEATSSLDSESERLIQAALDELMRGKTTIVIAHRLSTILRMDRIAVIDGGRVADAGTHAELIRKEGIYKKLWEIQAGGFIADEQSSDEALNETAE